MNVFDHEGHTRIGTK